MSTFIQDTKYKESAGLCPDCRFPYEALKHAPPLSRAYNQSAYILFCNQCKRIEPNLSRWGDWEKT